jgi:hypothetical protein
MKKEKLINQFKKRKQFDKILEVKCKYSWNLWNVTIL